MNYEMNKQQLMSMGNEESASKGAVTSATFLRISLFSTVNSVAIYESQLTNQVTFKPSSFLMANVANTWDHLDPVVKSAWGEPLPSHKIPDSVDS